MVACILSFFNFLFLVILFVFNKVSVSNKLEKILKIGPSQIIWEPAYGFIISEGTSWIEDSANSVILTGGEVDENVANRHGPYL